MRAKWTRSFLSQGRRLLSRRLASSARKRPRPLLSLSVAAGVAALAFTMSPDSARQLRNTVHLGALVLYESKMVLSYKDAAALVTQWSDIASHGGMQDELIECLLRSLDIKQSRDTLRFLIDHDVLSLLLQYISWNKPTDPTRLQRELNSFICTMMLVIQFLMALKYVHLLQSWCKVLSSCWRLLQSMVKWSCKCR